MEYLALTNFDLSLCNLPNSCKGPKEQEFKNESKKEIWLWRFMENHEIECVALRGHNSS